MSAGSIEPGAGLTSATHRAGRTPIRVARLYRYPGPTTSIVERALRNGVRCRHSQRKSGDPRLHALVVTVQPLRPRFRPEFRATSSLRAREVDRARMKWLPHWTC